MKTKSSVLVAFVFLMLLPTIVFSQTKEVLLKSGPYLPAENAARISISDPVFQKSAFNGKYYVVVQFYELPSQSLKESLKASGVVLTDYLPNNAYVATVLNQGAIGNLKIPQVRSIFYLKDSQKASADLWNQHFPAHAVKVEGFVDVSVITYEKTDAALLTASLSSIEASVVEEAPMFNMFTIRVKQSAVHHLINLPFVQWAELIEAPNQIENLPGRTLHRASILNDGVRNLKGDGISVGIWDGGEVSPHLDFSPTGRLTIVETSSAVDHATHCAGTILGRGLINPKARGMAPNAKIYSYNFNGNIQTEMATAIPLYGLTVSSHSYGSTQTCGLDGAGVVYSSTARSTDLNLNNFPNHLHVHSAGNSQSACTGGWSTITASGKPAKNNLLVANITSLEAMSSSSSFGPVQDGRVKPEISAMGTSVYSTTTPLNAYTTMSGTSMATPGVAGTAVLLQQRYKQLNGGAEGTSAFIKNIILNGAQDLGNVGPDYKFGYGRINALRAVKIMEQNTFSNNTIATGAVQIVNIDIPANTARLKVMLNWNDPAGAANANPALVNNLDLKVVSGANTYFPYILDKFNPGNPATTGVDNISNIEQVVVDNPPAGAYTVSVTGTAVASGPSQAYSLTWIIDHPYIELIYPNGNESFAPGVAETITWDNAGITGSQTIEYSIDNGTTWTVISNSVPGSTTRFSWTPPSVVTGTALIRISAGTINDVSDATFKILGVPTGLSASSGCAPGSVTFNWSAVTNATAYDVYVLNSTTGYFDVLQSNIVGTSYAATGLTAGTTLWFTVVAKNNINNAYSEKANAVSISVPATGNSPVIGAIVGQSNVCGGTSGITYGIAPVAGATYTWTVPAGATITGGQNSPAITVTFPAGSSGNVTVYAVVSGCQSNTSTFPVSVSNSSVSAPLSGGDQTQNVCLPDPIPTLTATATTTPGNTIIWYSAATGGVVVANPTLSAEGTITYYAASKSSDGCESTTRTAVTLTITTSAPATASASGATTFCQGGSVTLTASSGLSYSWSNGATTQSITVATSGTYTVQVRQANGCISTSNAITVTVNALPSNAVTVSGATSFCQGGSVALSAPAGNTYQWSNGATTQSINANISGNYSVVVTNAAGCTATSAATAVTVFPKPVVTLSAAPYRNLFPGLSTTLTANVNPSGSYTYTWYKNNNVIAGAATSSLMVNSDGIGSYSVKVVNTGGCENTSAALAIGDSVTTRLFVYPNPNTGLFNVSYYSPTNSSTKFSISVFDNKGAIVYTGLFNNTIAYQRMKVDIRKFGGGLYRVVLFDANNKRIATEAVAVK